MSSSNVDLSLIKRAYDMGRERAVLEFSKDASSKDAIMAAEAIGDLIGRAGSTAKRMGNAFIDKATNATELAGLLRDSPRAGLITGTGLAGAGLAATTLGHGKLLEDILGPAGMIGGTALAVGSNPGILGGSVPSRISREIAAQGTTPSGLLGITAGLVGLPAALIGYGRMKERQENTIF